MTSYRQRHNFSFEHSECSSSSIDQTGINLPLKTHKRPQRKKRGTKITLHKSMHIFLTQKFELVKENNSRYIETYITSFKKAVQHWISSIQIPCKQDKYTMDPRKSSLSQHKENFFWSKMIFEQKQIRKMHKSCITND